MQAQGRERVALQLLLSPADYLRATSATIADLTKPLPEQPR